MMGCILQGDDRAYQPGGPAGNIRCAGNGAPRGHLKHAKEEAGLRLRCLRTAGGS